MEQFGLALILFAAFWVGCAAGYIAMRLRAQVAYEKGRNESAAEIAALQERLNGRDQQFNEARQRADAATETATRLEGELRQETDRRNVAEARLTLLPKYESELETRGQKIAEQQKDLTRLHVNVSELNARLEESKKTSEDKINAIQALQARVAESFQSMSAEALVSNNKAFLDLAGDALSRLQDSARGDLDQRQTLFGQIIEPLKSSLDRVDARISELEKERATAYTGLQQQVESMMRTQASLQAETAHLATALRTPSSRGRWGEVQLRRVVELAGMLAHCDFVQPRASEEQGASARPDLIVQLPNHRQIVVDSKVSLAAYLESNDATDDAVRVEKRKQHAALVRAHVEQLSAKGYWEQFPQSPEFVVAFLPGEAFFSAALEHDPELLEFGVERRVILATPTTLIALLRAVAWGWKQELVSTNAREIRDLGKSLYDRLRTLAENFTEVQRSLSRTTAAFNRTVGVFETNVVPAARRFRELGAASGDEIAIPPPVDTTPRSLHLLAEATEVEEPKLLALATVAVESPAPKPAAPQVAQRIPAPTVALRPAQTVAQPRPAAQPEAARPQAPKPNGHTPHPQTAAAPAAPASGQVLPAASEAPAKPATNGHTPQPEAAAPASPKVSVQPTQPPATESAASTAPPAKPPAANGHTASTEAATAPANPKVTPQPTQPPAIEPAVATPPAKPPAANGHTPQPEAAAASSPAADEAFAKLAVNGHTVRTERTASAPPPPVAAAPAPPVNPAN